MTDPMDYCTTCHGSGWVEEPGRFYGDPSTSCPCPQCAGTGKKVVIFVRKKKEDE